MGVSIFDGGGQSWQSHNSADLVQGGLSLRTKRREDVAQIDGILGVSVEVGTHREARRGHGRRLQLNFFQGARGDLDI